MENKIYIRRCERFTIYQATDPVEIDIEKLKRCDPPYGGNSHSELLGYVQENLIDDWENWASNETNKERLSIDCCGRLNYGVYDN